MALKVPPILYYKSLNTKSCPINWVLFDLDNTIYPASSGLSQEMYARMNQFAAIHLNVDIEVVAKMRQTGSRKHGTTLRWLQIEHGLTTSEEFLDYVHPSNLSDFLKPQPKLPQLLESLEIPKAILTNSPRKHAERVLQYFGILDQFEHLFDLLWNGYEGKPHLPAYQRCLDALEVPANQTLFIDDISDYLEPFHQLGGHCIQINESELESSMPWPTIPSIFDIPNLLKKSPGAN